jgi:hypothetical protein
MADQTEYHGSLVAFEGPSDIISTQLRLLPTSTQILILPSVQNYLVNDDSEEKFEAKKYIHKVHNALAARNEAAYAFLRESTPASKRLVFMNGGTPSALALCVKTISQNETEGDLEKAGSIFDDLVGDGVAGLLKEPKLEISVDTEYSEDLLGDDELFEEELEPESEDPIIRAMRAADALDRQTECLQPSNELDLTIRTRPRSISLPMYSFADRFGDNAPFYVFGAPAESDLEEYDELLSNTIPSAMAPKLEISHYDDMGSSKVEMPNLPDTALGACRSPSCVGEAYGPGPLTPYSHFGPDVFSPRSDVFSILSNDPVEFGEAARIEYRASVRKRAHKRVRSLDRIYPGSTSYKDTRLRLPSKTKLILGEQEIPTDGRPYSCMVISNDKEPLSNRVSYIDGPRTVYVRSNRSTITLSSVPRRKRNPARASYVDRGTDAEEAKEAAAPFQTVLPFAEDLVIYFKDDCPEVALAAVMQSFKDGKYPILEPPHTKSEAEYSSESGSESEPESESEVELEVQNELQNKEPCENEDDNKLADEKHDTIVEDTLREQEIVDLPKTPESQHTAVLTSTNESKSESNHTAPCVVDMDEYDPYAYEPPSWTQKKQPVHIISAMRAPAPPTPAQTPPPPPVLPEFEGKFHDFDIGNCNTAVTMQNSLRSILNIHFPPEDKGYHQFHFPLLPELDGLWKPIFREAEPGSPRKDNRKIDQILAIGAQRGVKKDYQCAITGQLEKLGTKPSGVSRSGRLDFR